MNIYLHKILALVIEPIFILLLVYSISLIFDSVLPKLLLISFLILFSSPMISFYAFRVLESDYPLLKISEVETVKYAVVLSGMLKKIKDDDEFIIEFGGSVDRFNSGIKLMKAGKAESLIFTRGHLPWSAGKPEGEYLKMLSIDRGIEPNSILLTRKAYNTADEAQAVAELIDQDEKIILVTSAYHMKRAVQLFEQSGLKAIPFPTDFQTGIAPSGPFKYIPSSESLAVFSLFLREMAGRLYYRISQ